jgi:hypothetical protein
LDREFYAKLIESDFVPPKRSVVMGFINDKEFVEKLFNAGYSDILKERLLSAPVGIRFYKNHFLYHFMDVGIQNMLSGGIIDQSTVYHRGICSEPLYVDPWEPYVFKIGDLLFGFYIWLAACLVSSSIMALEWSWFHGKRTMIKVVNNSLGLYVILARLGRGFG